MAKGFCQKVHVLIGAYELRDVNVSEQFTAQEQNRRNNLIELSKKYNAYPDRYTVTHEIGEIASLEDGTKNVGIAGRVLLSRNMGKLTFARIADITGYTQICFTVGVLGKELYDDYENFCDIGDFIGVTGEIFTTKTGEKTLRVESYTLLSKALKPLPEKWHGLTDIELCYRHRYLDLIMNDKTQQRFLLRSNFIKFTRRFLEDNGYIEIETPVLINNPSGALARPFQSHHNALDIDVFLRIAPETYLKRAIVGGFTKVFEFARCFRNEGMGPNHLQDFTMLECYGAYLNYKDNIQFTQKLIKYVIERLFGTLVIEIGDTIVDFSKEWEVFSFRELLIKDAGIDINDCPTADDLRKSITNKGIYFEADADVNSLGKGNLIDLLYKKVSRPKIINPTFLTEHPVEVSPLARGNDDNPTITDRFQLVINGAEIINAYYELVNPIEQRKRLEEQAELNAKGDSEAMVMDNDYITAMEYGMPPNSGWGLGVDRIVQVLTQSANIRDCVLFPIMKPLDE